MGFTFTLFLSLFHFPFYNLKGASSPLGSFPLSLSALCLGFHITQVSQCLRPVLFILFIDLILQSIAPRQTVAPTQPPTALGSPFCPYKQPLQEHKGSFQLAKVKSTHFPCLPPTPLPLQRHLPRSSKLSWCCTHLSKKKKKKSLSGKLHHLQDDLADVCSFQCILGYNRGLCSLSFPSQYYNTGEGAQDLKGKKENFCIPTDVRVQLSP